MPPLTTAYIALGSNLGDRLDTLRRAALALHAYGEVVDCSWVYETAPRFVEDQPAFLNAVCALRTERDPEALLTALLDVEREFGRERVKRYGPRTLDLDILLMNDVVWDSETLTLPHPGLHARRFVLAPLSDVAPGVFHPLRNASVLDLLAECDDDGDIERVASPEQWRTGPEITHSQGANP